ncbi:hypothetical protein FALCPG4_001402 [Fusarium falciforme]
MTKALNHKGSIIRGHGCETRSPSRHFGASSLTCSWPNLVPFSVPYPQRSDSAVPHLRIVPPLQAFN